MTETDEQHDEERGGESGRPGEGVEGRQDDPEAPDGGSTPGGGAGVPGAGDAA